jgi:hypothetical protein
MPVIPHSEKDCQNKQDTVKIVPEDRHYFGISSCLGNNRKTRFDFSFCHFWLQMQ